MRDLFCWYAYKIRPKRKAVIGGDNGSVIILSQMNRLPVSALSASQVDSRAHEPFSKIAGVLDRVPVFDAGGSWRC